MAEGGLDLPALIQRFVVRPDVSGLGRAESALGSLGSKMTAVGGTLTKRLALPMLAFAAIALKSAEDVEKALNTIRERTGATGEKFDSLAASMHKIARSDVTQGFDDIAETMSLLHVRTGLTGTALETLSETVLNLNRITKGTGPSVQTITQLFANWKVATSEQVPTLDKLLRASQASGVPLGELADTVVRFGPILRGFGLNLQTATALIAAAGKAGIQPTVIMAGLRREFQLAAKAGEDPAKRFRHIYDELRNLGEKGGDAAQKAINAISVKEFGGRGLALGEAISSGKLAFEDLVKAMQNGKGTIAETAKETLTFADKLKIFKRHAEDALAPIGEKLFPILEKVLKALLPIVDGFAKFINALGPVGPALIAVAIAAAPLLLIFGKLFTLLSGVGRLFGFVRGATAAAGGLEAVGAGGAAAAEGVGGAAVAAEAAGGVVLGLGAAAILAAGAFAYFTLRHLDPTKKALEGFGKASDDVKQKTQDLARAQHDATAAQRIVNTLRAEGKTKTEEYQDALGKLQRANADLDAAERSRIGAQREQIGQLQDGLRNLAKPSAGTSVSTFFKEVVRGEEAGTEKQRLFLENIAKVDDALRSANVPLKVAVGQVRDMDIPESQKKRIIDALTAADKAASAIHGFEANTSKALGGKVGAATDPVEAVRSLKEQYALLDNLVAAKGRNAGKDHETSANLKELIRLNVSYIEGQANEARAANKSYDANGQLLGVLRVLEKSYPALKGQIEAYIKQFGLEPKKIVARPEIDKRAEAEMKTAFAKLADAAGDLSTAPNNVEFNRRIGSMTRGVLDFARTHTNKKNEVIAGLRDIAARFPGVRAQIDATIRRIQAIPVRKDVKVNVDDETARARISALRDYLHSQLGNLTVGVDVSVQGLAQAQRELTDFYLNNRAPAPHALGGRYPSGSPILVGERRPEILIPDRPGFVVPDVPGLARMIAGQSGGSSQVSRNTKVVINNPVPERAGDSLHRRMQTLSALGVFE